jgi:hypothetical protein
MTVQLSLRGFHGAPFRGNYDSTSNRTKVFASLAQNYIA